jgi:serine/threonine protein kinase
MAFDRLTDTLTQSDHGDELLPGTALFHGQYNVTRFINSGGFGITYLAKDSLDRDVVIKECFSSTFCRRTETRVRARSKSTEFQMHKIVRSFLNEARSLAKLSHPNIVGVHQVFEDNGTAYMAMDYIRGHDLLEIIEEKRALLKPELIVSIAAKLVSAIAYVHDHQLVHCDISPDNIFITHEGEPILIDFGAARRSAVGEEQKYSGLSVVKDGYSPHELYTSGGRSGPWSDIYSLAASLYHAISGEAPDNCQSRLAAKAGKETDPCRPLAGSFAGYPPGFLESIDRAMAVMPAARFQSAQDWLQLLAPAVQERKEKKVVFLRRVVAAEGSRPQPMRPASSGSALQGPVPTRVFGSRAGLPGAVQFKSPRPVTRVAEVDISRLRQISGFLGGWLVDSETGIVVASEGGIAEVDLESALTASIGVARANFRALESLKLDDSLDDIQVSLGKQVHVIRPLEKSPKVFICVALDKATANPGLARIQIKRVGQSLTL